MKFRGLVCALFTVVLTSLSFPNQSDAQSVLRVARGLTSNNITVLVNRAVVIDSAEPFTEVSVAQPEIADVSPLSDRSIYIFGRGRGATTLTLLGEGGRLITNVTISVEPDLAELKQRLNTLMPNEQIEVRTAGNGLVLSGVVSGKAKIDKAMSLARAYSGNAVTNMMSVGGTQQVNLRVRIAEIDRDIGKNIGVSTALFRTGDNNITPFVRTGPSITPNDEGTGFINVLSGAFGNFGAIFNIFDTFVLDLQIDAAESKGFARSLAEPNIVALSGEEANMLVGGETPIPVTDVSTGTISIEYRPIGVSLNFLPTVLDDDLINIAVSAEVTAIDPSITSESQGLTIFGFDVQRATTTIELRDGQSFAIAGLYQNTFSDAVEQVPFLGDLPVLGSLFRSTSFQKGDSELVIIVTANLVVPVDDINQLSMPTDRVHIPNEAELFLNGTIERGTPAGRVSGQEFDGDYGYVVE
ncbi:type II and III secretion system protein family protein [Rhodobacteraceae bacterium NNCM2]|nr:type II and III secretion system protein family protein [Coraliihabitans acroporae]